MFVIADDGPVRTVTIDNPARRNAIPHEGWRRLAEIAGEFEASEARVLVLTGAGGDFCSGADLGADIVAVEGSAATRYEWMLDVATAARTLHRLSKPTVAAVDGVAVGAGMNLALCCDVVIASDRARFSEIFVMRGLTVDFGGTWLLPRLVGLAVAKELALTGRMVDAAEALALGMVARVVPVGELADAAGAVAREVAAGAPLAQRFIKAGFDRAFEMSFEQALAYESQAQAVCLSSEDVVEGVAAFLEKRDPQFRGR
jgi:2-(1,2-epoxy-1,2-dihydrophenyl)acetyl-CoA isomerase